jgi:hypothetical protein
MTPVFYIPAPGPTSEAKIGKNDDHSPNNFGST